MLLFDACQVATPEQPATPVLFETDELVRANEGRVFTALVHMNEILVLLTKIGVISALLYLFDIQRYFIASLYLVIKVFDYTFQELRALAVAKGFQSRVLASLGNRIAFHFLRRRAGRPRTRRTYAAGK